MSDTGGEEDPSVSSQQCLAPVFNFDLIYPKPGAKVLLDQEPIGRSGHSMVTDGVSLFILGGYNPQGRVLSLQGRPTVFEELWKYNLATRKWTRITTSGFPMTCASSCMLMRGSTIYVFGGTAYPFGQIISNSFKAVDLSNPQRIPSQSGVQEQSYTWYLPFDQQESPAQDGDQRPPKGYGQSVVFHGDYLYTFGGAVGFYNEAIADLHRLSLHTCTWEKLEPSGEVPNGRYKQEIIKADDCFYIVGGGRLHAAQPVHILYSYHFELNTWQRHALPPHPTDGIPKPRNAFSLVQVQRDVYICGGQCYGLQDSPPAEILNDIWHLSLDHLQWRKLPVSLPERMYFHRAVLAPSLHMYIYGGVLESGKRSSKLYLYRLPFQVADLKELAWFQVTKLWSGLGRAHPVVLRETYGLPQTFIDRLQLTAG